MVKYNQVQKKDLGLETKLEIPLGLDKSAITFPRVLAEW